MTRKAGKVKMYPAGHLFCVLPVLLSFSALSGCGRREPALAAPPEEKRLVVATSLNADVYEPLILEYENRTGIFVTTKEVSTKNLDTALSESSADVFLGGSRFVLEDYAELFKTTDEEAGNEGIVSYSAVPPVIIYNTRLIRVSPPTGWESLLGSLWKGETAFADPMENDAALEALCTMASMAEEDPWNYTEDFYANLEGRVLSTDEEVIRAVVSGDCNVGVSGEDAALREREDGGGIGVIYPVEGTCALSEGVAALKGAVHRENADDFVRFIVSDDAQQYLVNVLQRRTAEGGTGDTARQKVIADKTTINEIGVHRNTVRRAWSRAVEESE